MAQDSLNRVTLRRVGEGTGKLTKLPPTWAELLELASAKVLEGEPARRVFTLSGDELDEEDMDLISAGEVLYVSTGKGWCPPPAQQQQQHPSQPVVSEELIDDVVFDEFGVPTVSSMPAMLAALESPLSTHRAEGAMLLALLVDRSEMDQMTLVGEYLREAGGVELLVELFEDEDAFVVQRSLMIIGNLCSDAVDPDASQTRELLHELDGGLKKLLNNLNSLEKVNLSSKLPAAVAWCFKIGAESVEDIGEEEVDEFVNSLDLLRIPKNKLLAKLKEPLSSPHPAPGTAPPSRPSSMDPRLWPMETCGRYKHDEMQALYDNLLEEECSRKESLVFHFTSKAVAELILGENSPGLRAAKAGQLGGGLSVCTAPPHELGWEKWGGGPWRENVGRALWGEKWEEVMPGGPHEDKLQVVFFIKLDKKIVKDTTRILPGRERVLIIPKTNLFSMGGDHWLSKDNIVKAYDMSS